MSTSVVPFAVHADQGKRLETPTGDQAFIKTTASNTQVIGSVRKAA